MEPGQPPWLAPAAQRAEAPAPQLSWKHRQLSVPHLDTTDAWRQHHYAVTVEASLPNPTACSVPRVFGPSSASMVCATADKNDGLKI